MTADIILLVVISFSLTGSFPPDFDYLHGTTKGSRTHSEITQHGLESAIVRFLVEYNYTNSSTGYSLGVIKEYFEADNDGWENYERTIDNIVYVVKEQEKSNQAYIHCNAEQLQTAHEYIHKMRSMMADLSSDTKPDLSLMQEWIGKSIYIIQSFYSSSNWVEMQSFKSYKDFGVPGRSLMPIADQNEDTCRDCDNSGIDTISCKDNLLTNKLTSGYKSGQIMPQLSRNTNSTTGKCGFGGSSDTNNGFITATGGINKDMGYSSYSPHYHLHGVAFIAARTATEEFLIDSEIGIINELGKDMFAKVFSLNKRHKASFGFVIDVTGSMKDDIVQVRKACVEIITDVLGTENEPEDYILCTFSDPENLTTVDHVTSDGLQMISRINNLHVEGGGDCQEYAMSGLIKCITECRENSNIFFFTDAPAKDKDRMTEIVNAANAVNTKLVFNLITPLCEWSYSSRRAKRSIGVDTYHMIAELTGGKVYEISTSEIVDVMKEVSEDVFPSSKAIIDFFELTTADYDEYIFSIDETCVNFKVTIDGVGSTTDVDILFNTGSIMMDLNTKALFESPSKAVIAVLAPFKGVYTLRRLMNNNWHVNITAQSPLDFSFKMLEEGPDGYMYELRGNPIKGKQYGIIVTPYNLPDNAYIDGITLTTHGNEKKMNFTGVNSAYFVMTTLTAEEYHLAIQGHIDNGTYWKRKSPSIIEVVSVQLSLLKMPDLYVGDIINVTYAVKNMGSEVETFSLTVSDNRGLILGDSTFSTTLLPDNSGEVTFLLRGSNLFKTVSFVASVSKTGDVQVLQKDRRTAYINRHAPPTCIVDVLNVTCNHDTGEDTSCADIIWDGTTTITFDTDISSINGSNGLEFTYDSGSPSPVRVNVSGDCCLQSYDLKIVDKDNNIAKCNFVVLEPKHEVETKPFLTTAEKLAIGTVGGIVAAAIIGVILFCFATYRAGIKPKLDQMKVNTFNINASKDLPESGDWVSKGSPFIKSYVNVPPLKETIDKAKFYEYDN